MIEFTVPGVPVAQPRQRHRVMMMGGKAIAQNYTPARDPVNAYKAAVQLAASQVFKEAPLQGPLQVELTFIFPRPKSMFWKKRDMPRALKVSKPDHDNLGKSLCDSLNGICWADDAQICDCRIRKFIASGDEQPRTIVRVWDLSDSRLIVSDGNEPSLFNASA